MSRSSPQAPLRGRADSRTFACITLYNEPFELLRNSLSALLQISRKPESAVSLSSAPDGGASMEMAEDSGSHAITRLPNAALRRVVLSGVIGTAVEWYDYFVYGAATALVFDKLFFPTGAAKLTTVVAFAAYGAGFVARPLGAVIFGHFGDKIGRKEMLVVTIILMGAGTSLIGLLPTYDQIRVAAPLLLVFLRLIQGIGLGGEWGGAVLIVVESACARHRGLFGSMVRLGNPIGLLAATAVFAYVAHLPDSQLLSGAWRIPFLISIVLVGLGLYIRLRLAETPAFRRFQLRNEIAAFPILEILTRHRRAFLIAIGLRICETACFRIATIFMIFHATSRLGLERGLIVNAIQISAFVALVAIPTFGWLSDKLGRKTMFIGSALFSIAFAFPLFALMETRNPDIVRLAMVGAIVFGPMISYAVGGPWYAEMFPTRLRYSGASLGFQVGATVGGILTPLVTATLIALCGDATWPISVYLIVCACGSLASAIAAPETSRKALT
jgi:MFS transporter, MHS family, shikimate and dehydroshikimate transport protein